MAAPTPLVVPSGPTLHRGSALTWLAADEVDKALLLEASVLSVLLAHDVSSHTLQVSACASGFISVTTPHNNEHTLGLQVHKF